VGWNRLRVRRGDMFRSGTTFGKGWNSVEAVRLTVVCTAGLEDLEIRFDDLHQHGGPIVGEVEYKYIYVRDDGTYVAKSAPSEVSERYFFSSEGAQVSIPADASRDSQVNQIWLYRRGAGLEDFYRVAVEDISGTGGYTIEDTLTAADALIVNIRLEEDNTTPPDDIIDIEGPYYDRLFALTNDGYLWPSRRLSPDTFSEGQAIQVAGEDEVALWVKKALGGLYVGTTRDIYLLEGTGAELPDDTVDFTLTPLNIDNPPQQQLAVAQEGNFLVYLAADGWRAFSGGGSKLLTGATSLLYRGKTRHGISPVNLTTGRLRAAIGRNQLYAITPEGAATTSSNVIYRYNFDQDRWYRNTYPNAFRCLYRDPDGNITASDSSGFVWVLDSGTQDDATNISYVFWTREDDFEAPFNRKDPYDFRVLCITGGANTTIALHLDHASSSSLSLTASRSTYGESLFNLSSLGLSSFRNVQLRVSGSGSSFRWGVLSFGYHLLPMMFRGHTPPFNFGHPGVKTTVGLQLRVCTLGAERTFTPVLDNEEDTDFTVTSETDEPLNHTHMFTYPARQVEEFYLKVDGDVEMYEWSPIVTAHVPLGTLVWDSGPMDLGTQEFMWPREVWLKAVCGDDLYVEPWFDGVNYGAVICSVPDDLVGTAAKFRIPIPRNYKGRIPRFVITSCEPFYPYWVSFVRRETGAKLDKPEIKVDVNFGGKVPA
jgi:hypothetical protein